MDTVQAASDHVVRDRERARARECGCGPPLDGITAATGDRLGTDVDSTHLRGDDVNGLHAMAGAGRRCRGAVDEGPIPGYRRHQVYVGGRRGAVERTRGDDDGEPDVLAQQVLSGLENDPGVLACIRTI